jgi:hypothetical protein
MFLFIYIMKVSKHILNMYTSCYVSTTNSAIWQQVVTLHTARLYPCLRLVAWLENNEVEWMWKEVVGCLS